MEISDVAFNTELSGCLVGEGGEDTEWSHLTPEKADGCLSHALLEAATRGQALTSYQGHRNLRIAGYPGAGGSELRLAASSPGRGGRGTGNGAELGL